MQPVRDLPVLAAVEERGCQADVEIHRASVSFEARLTTFLIDEQRGDQAADHDEVVHEVAQLGRAPPKTSKPSLKITLLHSNAPRSKAGPYGRANPSRSVGTSISVKPASTAGLASCRW